MAATNKRKSDSAASQKGSPEAVKNCKARASSDSDVAAPTKNAGVVVVHAVLMTTGDIHDFDSVADKDDFMKEYEDIVVETKEFTSRADFDDWKRTKELTAPPQKSTSLNNTKEGLTKMSPDDAVKTQKAVSRVIDTKPAQEIRIEWKTSPRSMAVCFVLRMIDQSK